MKNLKLEDMNELFAYLREMGYNPFISNGEIEVELNQKVTLIKDER